MKKHLIALLFIFFIYNHASSQDWVFVGEGNQDDSKYYIRNKTVENSSTKKAWIKRTGSKITVKKNGKTYTYRNGYQVTLYEYDCSENKLKLCRIVSYDSKGVVVESITIKEYLREWTDVVPDSIGEMILTKACSL